MYILPVSFSSSAEKYIYYTFLLLKYYVTLLLTKELRTVSLLKEKVLEPNEEWTSERKKNTSKYVLT